MIETLLASLLPTIFSRIFPNKEAAQEAQLQYESLQQQGIVTALVKQAEIATAQVVVNAEEAKSESLFKSGWRPFVGWGSGIIVILNSSIYFIAAILGAFGIHMPLPDMSITYLMSNILTGMLGLGLGIARSVDKKNGR